MSEANDRVIRSFSERLAVEQQVRALGESTSVEEQRKMAVEIARQEDLALSALLRQLDTDNAALRGGLGVLASQMDAGLIIPALRRVAADTRRSDEARLTAVMILERHLGQILDPELTRILPDPSSVARQSALQALALAQENPQILAEYALQLLAEPPETVQAVLSVINGIEDPARARLLLAIASYGNAALVAQILPMMGSIRHPLALESLQTLEHLVAAPLREAVQRQTRKLRLAGIRVHPDFNLRALLSPINAQGQSLLWFIHLPAAADRANLLAVVLHDRMGLLSAEAQSGLHLSGLPVPSAKGYVHRLRVMRSHYFMRMVELIPAVGLGLLDRAMEIMSETNLPWPSALVVDGHWLWSGNDISPHEWQDPPIEPAAGTPDDFMALLQHDAFASWVLDLAEVDDLLALQSPGHLLRQDDDLHKQVARFLVSAETAIPLSRRLRWQAMWLHASGDIANARLAMTAQKAFEQGDADHPFVNALAWRSLLAATDRRARSRR
ncbi:MAG: hypothetical protein J5I90_09500 [Caldilineales bacterium]|nr:hypothetical protein [Caldilineales bacterium]